MVRAKLIVFFGLIALLVGLIVSQNNQREADQPAKINNQELLADVSLLDPRKDGPEPSPKSVSNRIVATELPKNLANEEISSPPTRETKSPPPEVNYPGSILYSEAELLALMEKNQNSNAKNSESEPAVNSEPENSEVFNSDNNSEPSNPQAPQVPVTILNILISEIKLTGGPGKTQEDFIELYNPNSQPIDLSGWKLKKRTKTGSESSLGTFDSGLSIPAHGFFLWANSNEGFAAQVGADMARSYTVAANNSVALINSEGNTVDAVAWGIDLVNSFGEGVPIPDELEANQSYERKIKDSCARPTDEGELLGNGCDTDDNRADFVVRTVSHPQNTKSNKEPQ